MGTSTSRYVRKKKTSKQQDERREKTVKKIKDKRKQGGLKFDSINKISV